jgi:hypothetical protein
MEKFKIGDKVIHKDVPGVIWNYEGRYYLGGIQIRSKDALAIVKIEEVDKAPSGVSR